MEYIYPKSHNYQYDDKYGRASYSVSNFLNLQHGGSPNVTFGQFDHDSRISHLSIPAGVSLVNTPFPNLSSTTSNGSFSGGGAKNSTIENKCIKMISDEQYDKLFNLIKHNNAPTKRHTRKQGRNVNKRIMPIILTKKNK